MDNPSYVTLSRQTGLLKDLNVIANNLANMSTEGFRRESVAFTEVLKRLDVQGGSISQADANARFTDFSQAELHQTNGSFDFAIEGDGFFLVETPAGPALTRAGSFARSIEGELVTTDGNRVLGEGEAPLFFPADAEKIEVAADGTISADGQPVGQIALVTVEDTSTLTRQGAGLFMTTDGFIPAENATVFHGYVEKSNVDPVREITRMIEVQRSYEMGQSFLSTEDERMRQVIRVMGGG